MSKIILEKSGSVLHRDRSVRLRKLWGRMIGNRWLYFMLLPGVLYFIIYKYFPMVGVVIAFQDYQAFLGIQGSDWVGLKHFERFFSNNDFGMLLRNTLYLAFYDLIFFYPLPIIVSLMLNELRVRWFKRTVQSLLYLPHFMSWVVVVGIAYTFLTTEGGIINEFIDRFGGEKIQFLLSESWFRPLIIMELMWKETGWGTIIFLAALSGVPPELYEASHMDGANRWRQIWHVTLPAIRSTIVILLILRLGNFLDTGFEQIFLMLNPMNRAVGEVFDTYVYTTGILSGLFSYSAAVGVFKSVVGLILVFGANYLARKFGEEGVF